jgi:plastocyanin
MRFGCTFFVLGVALLSVVPSVSGTPAACTENCIVNAVMLGYAPPAFEVADGTQVRWHSIDVAHANWETPPLEGPLVSCFRVASGPGADSKPVTFAIDGETLTATVDATTLTCLGAVALPGGAFLFSYHCGLHKNMRGELIVTP